MNYESLLFLSLISVYSFIAGCTFSSVLTGMRLTAIATGDRERCKPCTYFWTLILSVIWPLTLLIALLRKNRQKVDIEQLQRMSRLLHETLKKSDSQK